MASISGIFNLRVVAALGTGFMLTAVLTAFAASNTVPASKAGDGSNTISGYTITGVHYGLNATSPQNIDTVAFTPDSAPAAGSTVRVKLVAAGSTWYNCAAAGANISCPTTSPQATALAADELRVVVAD